MAVILAKCAKKGAGNFGLNCDYFGQNCDMCLAHTRTRIKKIATYNVHPFGVHIWVPFRAPIGAGNEPKASGRATTKKRKINRDL